MENGVRNRIDYRKKGIAVILVMLILFLGGCDLKEKQIVLYTGFAKNEVFRIEDSSCFLPELMVYLTATQNRYEEVYGEQIWSNHLEGVTMEENMKDMVLAQLSQIKAMNLLAEKEEVELTREEKEKVKLAADEFFNSLSKEERVLLNLEESLIAKMYEEYALANKLYYYLVRDINPEVSDDEARTITIEHILIKTYSLDEKGEPVRYEAAKKKRAYDRANEVLERLKNGEDFGKLVDEYNEDEQSIYSFRKGELNLDFETTAFNLAKDEISNIVETEYGYHIIKCLTTFNQEETDSNKIKIVEKKREEAFDQTYSVFVAELTKIFNEKLWNRITLWKEGEVDCSKFFSIYEEYLGEAFDSMEL
ncbi:MAG: peptidylprolyl isomerase [Lachnospiraceae bacterium]|nr:peptidylprolyl isomerase [Lachnospiraceae bacterium]